MVSPNKFLAILLAGFLVGCGDSNREDIAEPVPPVATASGSLCGEIPLATRPLRYCYEDRAGQGNSNKIAVPVIYYFHGLGSDVNDIFEGGNRFVLDALARAYGSEMPIIVGLSVGNNGVLGEETIEVAGLGLERVEGFIAPGKQIRRTLMGGSMGGHNVLRLSAQTPEKFSAVAALCPAIATFNGHRQNEVDAYIARHEPLLDRNFFEQALASYKTQLSTEEIWERNNPLNLVATGAYDQLPIFVSVGIEDQLGFVEGSREFTSRARARGVNVDYHEIHGVHCVFDLPALMRFLRANTGA